MHRSWGAIPGQGTLLVGVREQTSFSTQDNISNRQEIIRFFLLSTIIQKYEFKTLL